MLYEELRARVCTANIALGKSGLVTLTWGNVSEADHKLGVFAIKPSGVPYDLMTPGDIVIMSFEGSVVDGTLNPSSDSPTHAELYRRFESIGGVCHTHSRAASAWAQAGRSIPVYGTTHADFARTQIPCTRPLTDSEVAGDYELETGRVICELFEVSQFNPLHTPAVLVRSHAPFTWGGNAQAAVNAAITLEEVAAMAAATEAIAGSGQADKCPQNLLDKHFNRKHGENAYYGQK